MCVIQEYAYKEYAILLIFELPLTLSLIFFLLVDGIYQFSSFHLFPFCFEGKIPRYKKIGHGVYKLRN